MSENNTTANGLSGNRNWTPRLVNRTDEELNAEQGMILEGDQDRLDFSWDANDLFRVNRSIAEHMKEKGELLFTRGMGGKLSKLMTEHAKVLKSGGLVDVESIKIHEMSAEEIMLLIAKHATFRGRRDNITPPKELISSFKFAEPAGFWPRLDGFACTPFMRTDRTIADRAGYDESSELYLHNLPEMEGVPEACTEADAKEALALLEELFGHWDFGDGTSKGLSTTDDERAAKRRMNMSAALSFAATGILYAGQTCPPIFIVNAPRSGSGKTYLVDCVYYLSLGRVPIPLNYDRGSDEFHKRLDIAIMEGGDQLLDNVNGTVGNERLDTWVTAEKLKPRILGRSSDVVVRNIAVKSANGNNITPRADFVRRCVYIELDANFESAATRTFDADPLGMIKEDRGKYVRAFLVIAKAYEEYLAAGGERLTVQPFSGFTQWSRCVVEPLVWAGCGNPLGNLNDMQSADPQAEDRAMKLFSLIDAIECGLLPSEFTAKDVSTIYNDAGGSNLHHANVYADIKAAFSDNNGKLSRPIIWAISDLRGVHHSGHCVRESRAGTKNRAKAFIIDRNLDGINQFSDGNERQVGKVVKIEARSSGPGFEPKF